MKCYSFQAQVHKTVYREGKGSAEQNMDQKPFVSEVTVFALWFLMLKTQEGTRSRKEGKSLFCTLVAHSQSSDCERQSLFEIKPSLGVAVIPFPIHLVHLSFVSYPSHKDPSSLPLSTLIPLSNISSSFRTVWPLSVFSVSCPLCFLTPLKDRVDFSYWCAIKYVLPNK